ncbi:MAG: acyltransferase [Nitrososphaerota archaeon]|nr:acyltransferase [Nitrososphaerota archaeon]MDG6912622.1 acyltransferase [Nitrososphaerota archaeon]MDG6937133.1 acyltransferase [Nitrososphaerota archaeon]MDG6962456.1 acyltransferase [Nitrososphaerota archaeon]MDG6969997.1 acyltransferase [Nitrososphaerota archaeon]
MTQDKVRLGLVQMSMSADRRSNQRKARWYVREAASQGADIVCLPELFQSRYFPSARGSFEKAEEVPGPTSRWLSETAKESRVILVGGSIFEKDGRRRYNTCLVYDEKGKRASKYRKVHIPQDEHYYEQDYFKPGDRYSVARTAKGRLGTLICFDQWYPEAARVNRIMGADILLYPTAIGWVDGIDMAEGDWKRAWEEVQVGHAIANSVVVCAVNRVGKEGPTTFWGGSFVCDQFGRVMLRADDSEGVFTADCDLGLGKAVEAGWGFFRNRQRGTYSAIGKR